MDETPLQRRLGMKRAAQSPAEDLPPAEQWEQDRPEPARPGDVSSVRKIVREMIETLIFGLVVFLLIRGAVQHFKIEGQSMEPNFHTSQHILVNKLVYLHFDLNTPARLLGVNRNLVPEIVYPFHLPRRGEVIVFEYPRDRSKDYIKRVIGLPGETVEIRDGRVYINGTLLDEPYIQDQQTSCQSNDPCGMGRPFTVPPGTVFVLGDNRGNSSDSREWAELPLDRIIGKAWVSYWPQDYWGIVTTPSYAARP